MEQVTGEEEEEEEKEETQPSHFPGMTDETIIRALSPQFRLDDRREGRAVCVPRTSNLNTNISDWTPLISLLLHPILSPRLVSPVPHWQGGSYSSQTRIKLLRTFNWSLGLMSRMRVEADISISVICINIESNVTVFQSVAYSIYLNISVSQDLNFSVLVFQHA